LETGGADRERRTNCVIQRTKPRAEERLSPENEYPPLRQSGTDAMASSMGASPNARHEMDAELPRRLIRYRRKTTARRKRARPARESG
jgi:hypothetical protein